MNAIARETTGAIGVANKDMANALRFIAADAVQRAESGHPGMPMGMADVATVLFTRFLKFNPADPEWQDRDRFVLSAGHGSMLLYGLLHLTGYKHVTLEEIRNAFDDEGGLDTEVTVRCDCGYGFTTDLSIDGENFFTRVDG